ncbi:MAG: winged helix-turn-helix transcriptional regulator [Synergistaceae bacterium]|nr:winged helix-turn-helix transcriptional regulator [Synergistaceae bacterium]
MTENYLCPLKHLANTFGGKWKLPIICILSSDDSPKRYSAIKRRLGNITNLMLAQSLRELESSGLVHREQYNEIPPRVEYSLTERGKSALSFITYAAQWAIKDLQENSTQIFCAKCVITD